MTRSSLRSPISHAEAVEKPGGVAGFGVRPGQADRPMPNGVAFLRRDLGHAVVDVAAEGPGEPESPSGMSDEDQSWTYDSIT
jgi:hypothetical protein